MEWIEWLCVCFVPPVGCDKQWIQIPYSQEFTRALQPANQNHWIKISDDSHSNFLFWIPFSEVEMWVVYFSSKGSDLVTPVNYWLHGWILNILVNEMVFYFSLFLFFFCFWKKKSYGFIHYVVCFRRLAKL